MAVFGKDILYFESVTSTFDKLLEFPLSNGLAIVSESQTGGIGRNGREWLSDKGGLYFSFYIVPECDAENIPFLGIVCALAAYNTVSKYVPCRIKWPNDIVSDGKKICGILNKSGFCGESSVYVMSGIGINANNTQFGELDYRATSIKNIMGKDVDREELLNLFFKEFENVYFNMDADKIMNEYKKSCITLGSCVAVHYNTDGTVFEGKCVDICRDGSIDVLTDDGIVNVNSGEVSVRGIYGYV